MKGTIQKTIKPLSRFAGALMLVASFLFTGCPNKVTVKPEMFAVTFSAGEHGTVKATVDSKPITSGDAVQKDKMVVFTAKPADGYDVEKWTVNSTTVENTTTASYSRKITAKTEVKVFFKPSGDTKYTVRHLQEGLDGKYGEVEADVQTLTGTTGNNTEATAKTYTGFITPTVDQKPIKGDGSTVIEIKYARKEITLMFDLQGGSTATLLVDNNKVKGRFGADVRVEKPEKDGYAFSGWNPELPEKFPAENATYIAQWAKLHPVTFSVEGTPPNGTLAATLDGKPFTGGDVAEGKTVEFMANDDEYAVGNWTVTPTAALIAGGQPGESTAKVKVTAATTVKVTFSPYKKVTFEKLDDYLKTANAASDGIYYIEVTDLAAPNVKGENWSDPSPLGMILKSNPSKKVALKLGAITGLTDMGRCFHGCANLVQAPVIPNGVTDMSLCFSGCTSLTQAPVIPGSVTDMRGCFDGCKNLTQAPEIPNSVTNMSFCFYGCKNLTQAPVIPDEVTHMNSCFSGCTKLTSVTLKCNYPSSAADADAFKDAFGDCHSLTANSIKVPAGQLSAYQGGASNMRTTADRFVAE